MRADRRRFHAALLLGACLALAAGLRGDSAPDARVRRIGAQLICTCGCTQGAMVCNHVGCPVVTRMQAEIRQRAQSTDSDGLVLQAFVQEYGTQVLANPTTQGFNLLAWVIPWVALGCGLFLVLFFVRRWRLRSPAPAGAASTPNPAAQSRIEAEIQAAIEDEFKL